MQKKPQKTSAQGGPQSGDLASIADAVVKMDLLRIVQKKSQEEEKASLWGAIDHEVIRILQKLVRFKAKVAAQQAKIDLHSQEDGTE